MDEEGKLIVAWQDTENDTLFIDGDWIESKDIVFDNSQIRYITTGNIGEGIYKEQGLTYITEETFNKLKCTEIFPGDCFCYDLFVRLPGKCECRLDEKN